MGRQHYQEEPFFNRTLKEQQEVDRWKKSQALLHGFEYLEIPYTDFDIIDKILAQRLSRKESREIEKESTSMR